MTAPNLPGHANSEPSEDPALYADGTAKPFHFSLASHLAEMNVAIAQAASYDTLTGTLVKDVVKFRAEEMLKADKPVLIAFLDLDEFKPVNDIYGHAEGDRMLAELGDHLVKHYQRKTDFVGHGHKWATGDEETEDVSTHIGRIGGDEFMFAIDLTDRQRTPEALTLDQRVDSAKRYLEDGFSGFVARQNPAIIERGFTGSIGYAVSDPETGGTDLPELMAIADADMYDKKHDHYRQLGRS